MPFEAYGSPQYGLNDAKIASWQGGGVYGTPVDVMSAQMVNVTMRTSQAELTGDDTITATASRPIGATVTMRYGGINIAVLEVLIGNTATSSVGSPNAVKNLRIAGAERMPYIGVVAKSLAEEGGGDFLTFIPKAKIMGDFTLVQQEYGAFSIPEVTLNAVADPTYGIISLIQRQTTGTFTMPPANVPVIA